MTQLLLKKLPQCDCILRMAERFPECDPLATEVFLNIHHTNAAIFSYFEENFGRKHDITQGRFVVLMLLLGRAGEPCSPAELADDAGVARPTITGLVDGLERDGLVTRDPSPDDRRMMLLRLTPKANDYLTHILPDYFNQIRHITAGLSESEQKTLIRLLTKVVARAMPPSS